MTFSAKYAWPLIFGAFLLSLATWFFREDHPALFYVVWTVCLLAGVYSLVVAWRTRSLALGLAGVAAIFADAIVYFVMFALALVFGW